MKHLKLSLLASTISLLTACGGGSSSSTPTPNPDPTPSNVAPTVNAGEDITAVEQTSVNLVASATDSDGTITSYHWSQTAGDSVKLDNTNNAELTFVAPTSNEQQTLSFTVTATDNDGATASDTIDVVIMPNAAPTVNAGEDATVIEFSQVIITATAADSDGEIASYQWNQTAGESLVLEATDQAELSFVAPAATEAHTLSFEVIVTDNHGKIATDNIDITVTPTPNALPTVNAGEDITTTELSAITLTASAQDSDGNIATYSWTQTAGQTVELNSTDSAELSFIAPISVEQQTLTFAVTVTDNEGATATDSINVIVEPSALLSDITFADSNLTNCIIKIANDNNWQRIAQVTSLDCDKEHIYSLGGIEQLVALEHLSVYQNQLSDITPVLALNNLRSLNIGLNQIAQRQIDQLTETKTWTHLKLSSIEMNSLTNFVGMNDLVELDVAGNHIIDTSVLAQLPQLHQLDISENSISDISFVDSLTHLHSLTISQNPINDISNITNKKHWQKLGLGKLKLTDIGFLAGMNNLTSLDISNNHFTDINVLETLQNLTQLHIGRYGSLDLEPISKLPNLIDLNIQSNDINFDTNTAFLSQMTQLEHLNLDSTNLKDASVIAALTKLKSLQLRISNELDNSEQLSALTQLENLALYGGRPFSTEFYNIDFLSDLTSLNKLTLHYASEAQMAELATLVNLEDILVIFSETLNLNYIKDMTALRRLNTFAIKTTNLAALSELNKLSSISLTVTDNEDLNVLGNMHQLRNITITGENTSSDNPLDLSFIANLPNLASIHATDTHFDFNTVADNLTQLNNFGINNGQISEQNLAKLTNLSLIALSNISLTNSDFFSQMPKLQYVLLSNNDLSDFSALSTLSDLNQLYLKGNRFTQPEVLTDLPHLMDLTVSSRFENTVLTDISGYESLTQLRKLDLSYNAISDISPLSNLVNINELNLRFNQISDISPLTNLTNLTDLDLSVNNNIDNIEPLFEFENLQSLDISSIAPLSCEEQTRLKQHFANITFWYTLTSGCQ